MMVMNSSQAKVQGQRSVISKERVETNGWTKVALPVFALSAALMQLVKMVKNSEQYSRRPSTCADAAEDAMEAGRPSKPDGSTVLKN